MWSCCRERGKTEVLRDAPKSALRPYLWGVPGTSAHAPHEPLGHLPRHRYLVIEVQTLNPSLLQPDNVLSVIARFEHVGSAIRSPKLPPPDLPCPHESPTSSESP